MGMGREVYGDWDGGVPEIRSGDVGRCSWEQDEASDGVGWDRDLVINQKGKGIGNRRRVVMGME